MRVRRAERRELAGPLRIVPAAPALEELWLAVSVALESDLPASIRWRLEDLLRWLELEQDAEPAPALVPIMAPEAIPPPAPESEPPTPRPHRGTAYAPLRGIRDDAVRKICRDALDAGWDLVATRSHYALAHDGERVSVPGTTGDHRSAANLRAELRRHGVG